ncbi:DUF1028 domain-containing protein [Halolamina salifodinae]|uniref:DUF1028 domain-containing protein n=1 Tax=Halolamina salifodinae TaxID=1202767 RepID=UPI003643AB35
MTFSIVAKEGDAVGIAVQSKFVSVGSVVPFASADAGAIATQSFANVAYGEDGLEHLRNGLTAEETVERLTEEDDEAERRQVGVVGVRGSDASASQPDADAFGDADGSVAGFTGEDCFDTALDVQGENYTVQGNILENEETVYAMAGAFEDANGGLPERLLAALEAGDEAGGDSRGKQAAALYVVKPEGGYDGGNDRWIDVRVDDHETPIQELRRVFKLYDVTLLGRKEPDDVQELDGQTAKEVAETLVDLGHLDVDEGTSSGSRTASDDVEDAEGVVAFAEPQREALEAFRGFNNFENHSLPTIEDALARGWDDAEGEGEERMVDAIWHGLQRLERQ